MCVRAALFTCVLSRLASGLLVDSHSARTLKPESDKCNASVAPTVAYVFLAREHLPLWPVWEDYFKGCPNGSYTVLAHTQTPGAALGNHSFAGVSSVHGKELPASRVQNGELRYNWAMVEAMFQLYGEVIKDGAAPNGCAPQWIQMLSDACAPVRTCTALHSLLTEHAGSSFVQQIHVEPHSERLRKSSQWTTLWWEHAHALWKSKSEIRHYWGTRGREPFPDHERMEIAQDLSSNAVNVDGIDYGGALDEFVIATELKKRKADLTGITLTSFDMNWDGHPTTFTKPAEVKHFVRSSSLFFARKFEGNPEVVTELRKLLAGRKDGEELAGAGQKDWWRRTSQFEKR